MRVPTGSTLAVIAAAGLLAGTAVHVHAAEIGFLEMLFGARPAPQAQPVQPAPGYDGAYRRSAGRIGAARHRLRVRYAALPVRIHAKDKDAVERQTPIDMGAGAAAALLKDETLRPGDIVVLKTGARVFTGDPDKRHAMRDFEPVQSSAYVSRDTRRLLAGMLAPTGAVPADAVRRTVARMRSATPAADTPVPTQAAMRVINVWQTGR